MDGVIVDIKGGIVVARITSYTGGPLPVDQVFVEADGVPGEPLPWPRAERDQRLAACDWTQMPDVTLTDDARAAWRLYRTALRDLPRLFPDPARIVWPVSPA